MRHTMNQRYIKNEQIKNITPTNLRITPVEITVPKVLPKRDDKVIRL